MTNIDIANNIHNAWNEFSAKLFCEKSTFTASDIEKAFYEGSETVLMLFGIVDKNHEYTAGDEYEYSPEDM